MKINETFYALHEHLDHIKKRIDAIEEQLQEYSNEEDIYLDNDEVD